MKIKEFGFTVTVKLVEIEEIPTEQRSRRWYQINGQYGGFDFLSGREYGLCSDTGQIVDFNGFPLDGYHEKNMVRELIEKFEEEE